MKKFFQKLLQLLDDMLSLFYPRSCIACGMALQRNEKQLCINCLLHLPETNYHLAAHNSLEEIFWGRAHVEHVYSYLFFRKGNAVQSILHQLKYKGNKEIGAYMGKRYGRELARAGCLRDIDVIVPIPLHRKKLRIRGYNQSEWIAKGLAEGLNVPYSNDFLVRATFTETQTKKSRFSRWENVKEVFAAQQPAELAGKHVLVCDDVLTTGATMEAAIRKLLEIKDVRVSVVTIATAK